MRFVLRSLRSAFRTYSTAAPPNGEAAAALRRSVVAEEGMGVTKEDVEAALSSSLNPSLLVVTDTSGGCGASFEVEVVSGSFEGKRLLERHRMVNAALAKHMPHIHALSITKALAPSQFSKPQPVEAPQS